MDTGFNEIRAGSDHMRVDTIEEIKTTKHAVLEQE
jgi:hypothetical protein